MASKLGTLAARRFVSGPSAVAGEHSGGSKRWKILTFLVALPSVAVCYVNAFMIGDHHMHRDEFVPYSHLRLRTKNFPWGDGKHSLFHNGELNPLPTGYEDEK